MACGTGKTFVTLKIAEEMVGKGGTVLYLVPSISLLSQSMREWASQGLLDHRYVGVCSDVKAGRDSEDESFIQLPISVTTDPTKISNELVKNADDKMTVVFSTYQSLAAISASQKIWGREFDLVICDEAHRTTGAGVEEASMKLDSGQKQKPGEIKETVSYFHAVHRNSHINAKKRLYTTATPKRYDLRVGSALKEATKKHDKEFTVYTMDDVNVYGEELHTLKFSDAINQELLTDYKVVVLTVHAGEAAYELERKHGKMPDVKDLNINSMAKLIGGWRALRDPEANSFIVGDTKLQNKILRSHPLQRAIAFSNTIAASKKFRKEFDEYVKWERSTTHDDSRCSVAHVDGEHHALARQDKLDWLRESGDDMDECRILSNARCLTEGVDVPALDAVLFMGTKRSTIDVIQAVGRVMRRSVGKKYGYIIIPVVVNPTDDVQTTLDDDRAFAPVWDVLRALRAHDDRIEQRLISGIVPNLIIQWPRPPKPNGGTKGQDIATDSTAPPEVYERGYEDDIRKISAYMRTKIADKVGDRRYLESWADDVAGIVQKIKRRIDIVLKSKQAKDEFVKFHDGLKKIINDEITIDEAIDMLAQHMVMGRVFNALFEKEEFTKNNTVSISMNAIMEIMKDHGMENELEELKPFYLEIESRVSSIDTNRGRQEVLYQLYDKFFQNAFKRTAERLGIVYTPVEIVDFVLLSVDYLLKEKFNRRLSSKRVHILDPFTGTGTFISRLVSKDLGLISDSKLEYKYTSEIHANEIILLAYYVAAVNCESTVSDRLARYLPFDGLVLTDTFHFKDIDDRWNQGMFTPTQMKIKRQRDAPITVIVGNPPWSMGAKIYSGLTRMSYKEVDEKIKNSYLRHASGTGARNALYDSYVRAIRWATDRLRNNDGVIAFVINAGFLRSDAGSGIRRSLMEEFSEIWLFDLRGQKGTPGDGRNIFEYTGKSKGGTTVSSVIMILVKKQDAAKGCTVKYTKFDETFYSGQEKRDYIKKLGLIKNIESWGEITLDQFGDWLNHRNVNFYDYLPLGTRATKSGKVINAIFKHYSGGVKTNRDAWSYNSDKSKVASNMKRCVTYCNAQDPDNPKIDLKRGKWTGELKDRLKNAKPIFSEKNIRVAQYRPFFKQWLYYDTTYINTVGIVPAALPTSKIQNVLLCVPYKFNGEFSAMVTNVTPDLELVHHSQCFPLYTYENGHQKENLTEQALQAFRRHYKKCKIEIGKEDVFYYIYGLFHHPGYKQKYANNLMKEFPRIPFAPDFKSFAEVGRDLAQLHLNYECGKRHPIEVANISDNFTKISFKKIIGVGHGGRIMKIDDKSTILLDNKTVIVENIPNITYKVNGRTPVEWVVARYRKKIDRKSSQNENNPCTNADIADIIKMAIHVGVESDRLIGKLPTEFEPVEWKRPQGPLFWDTSQEFDEVDDALDDNGEVDDDDNGEVDDDDNS